MRIGLAVASVALAVVAAASSASAHGDDGVFAGTDATPGDGLSVNVRARLVYANDNEPAPGAFMVVDAVDAAGMSTAPALLTDNRDGTYQGVLMLPAPGAWTLRFQSTTPNAATEVAYTAPAPTGPTAPTNETTTDGSLADGDESDDGGRGSGAVIALVALAAVALAAGVWLLVRRLRT